jgi:hypothetical protein
MVRCRKVCDRPAGGDGYAELNRRAWRNMATVKASRAKYSQFRTVDAVDVEKCVCKFCLALYPIIKIQRLWEAHR